MRDTVALRCVACGKVHWYTAAFLRGAIKSMKLHKCKEVAQQMHDKRGRFYDKWLAAMEKRGEQKRCKTCLAYQFREGGWPDNYCSYHLKFVNPGQFRCLRYIEFDRG